MCCGEGRGKFRGVSGLAELEVLLPPLEVEGGGRDWPLLQEAGGSRE